MYGQSKNLPEFLKFSPIKLVKLVTFRRSVILLFVSPKSCRWIYLVKAYIPGLPISRGEKAYTLWGNWDQQLLQHARGWGTGHDPNLHCGDLWIQPAVLVFRTVLMWPWQYEQDVLLWLHILHIVKIFWSRLQY